MSLLSKIILLLASVVALCAIIKSLFGLYKKSYFKSNKFIELSRESDSVSDLYIELKSKSQKLKKLVFTNFSPPVQDQAKMQNYDGESFKRNNDLPAHTYLCSDEIFKRFKPQPYEFLRQCCGFSDSSVMRNYMNEMLEDAMAIEGVASRFEQKYVEIKKHAMERLPLVIKLFSKQQAFLMLGLKIDKNWKELLFPIYTLQNMDNKDTFAITINPQEMNQIILYFQKNNNMAAL